MYGLELIPANMIERVEVIRGGGSALCGSNAIAGTINLILKDPINNYYQRDFDTGIDRDPGYIYGPMRPRTIYFGLKIGNLLR